MSIANTIRSRAPSVVNGLSYEPSIMPDLRKADVKTIAAAIIYQISIGNDKIEDIITYLKDRKVGLGRRMLEFIVEIFEGDDEEHHLWQLDNPDSLQLTGQINWHKETFKEPLGEHAF